MCPIFANTLGWSLEFTNVLLVVPQCEVFEDDPLDIQSSVVGERAFGTESPHMLPSLLRHWALRYPLGSDV